MFIFKEGGLNKISTVEERLATLEAMACFYKSQKGECETKIDLLFKNVQTQIQSLKEATDLAREGIDFRLAQMNEFRNALKDQSTTFFTKAEHILFMDKVNSDIRELRESRAKLEGKADQTQLNISLIIGVLGLVLGAVSILHSILG